MQSFSYSLIIHVIMLMHALVINMGMLDAYKLRYAEMGQLSVYWTLAVAYILEGFYNNFQGNVFHVSWMIHEYGQISCK